MKVMRKIMGLSLVFCLTLGLTCAPVRADDPKDKAALPDQAKKPGAVFKVPGHTMDVALTADGKILASAGTGKTIDLWDVASGKKLHTLKGQSNMWPPVFKVAFSPDGKTLVSAGSTKEGENLSDDKADEASAVKAVENLYGKVTRDDKLPGKPVIGVTLNNNGATDASLKELKDLKQLTSLNLAATQVTDAGLKELKHLKQLTSLDFYGTAVTDAGLKELKHLKQLTSLNLAGALQVSDAGLKELKHLKQLTTLDLSVDLSGSIGPTDAGLKELKDLKQLTTLKLYGTEVTDAGLKELKHLKQLTSLKLTGTKVTDAGVKELQAALPELKIEGAPDPKADNARGAAAKAADPVRDEPPQDKLDGEQLRLTGHTGRVLSVCVSADGKRLLTCSDADKTLRLWDAYTGKCLRVFEGHTDGVISAALSPDGKRVLSGGGDKTVRLWDADTGKELRQMTGHTTAVFSVAFGPEGKAISGGARMDGTMRLWDLNTGKQAAVFSVDGYIVALAYSAKARLAATYTWTRIRLWDLETGKEVRKWTGHGSDFFESVSFSPDGERLLSASPGGPVCIWDVKSGKELKQIQAHKEVTFGVGACCAAFSPDGKRIVSGGKGGVRVWDAESGKEVHKYEGDTGEVFAVAFFPDGKRIASASVDGTVRIWRAPGPDTEQKMGEDKKEGQSFKAPGSHTHDVTLSPDGKILARAGSGQADLWDVASGKQLHTLKGHTKSAVKVAFSPDGKTLASGTGYQVMGDETPGEVKLWDVATGKELVLVKGHPHGVVSMAFSADGKTLATSSAGLGDFLGAVKLWDVASGKEKLELGVCAWSLAFSPDGKTLAMGVDAFNEKKAPSVQLWDLTTGKQRASMPGNRQSFSLAFTPDGKTLVSAGGEKDQGNVLCLKSWEVATAKERATIAIPEFAHPQFIPLVFTADGRTLITAGWNEKDNKGELTTRLSVQYWDLATGKARATFWTAENPGGDPVRLVELAISAMHEHALNVAGPYFAALSADGKTVAWGGTEGAHAWDVQSLATSPPKIPKEVAEKNKDIDEQLCLTGHTSHVWGVCVSADGKRLLTSSTDSTLRLWDADTGQCLRVFEGHTGRVAFGAALSPDGKRVLSGSDDKTLRLWDADTGKEIRKMTGHTAGVDGVAFGPRGMAISTSDRTMHLWDLKTGKQAGVFTGHTGLVSNVAYSDQARLAATCGHAEDPSIRLWDLRTGKELRKLTGPSPPISSVCFSSDGKRLLSSAPNDNTVRVWDVESGTELKRIESAHAYNAAFSPDDKRIVSGGLHDNTVRVWDAASGQELRHYEGHTASVTGVAFFPDGKRIASASFDGTARIWRAPNPDAKPAPLKEQEDAKPLPKGPDAKAQSAAPAAQVKKPADQAAEEQAMAAIEKIGGDYAKLAGGPYVKFTRDEKAPGKPVIGVTFATGAGRWKEVTDAVCPEIAR